MDFNSLLFEPYKVFENIQSYDSKLVREETALQYERLMNNSKLDGKYIEFDSLEKFEDHIGMPELFTVNQDGGHFDLLFKAKCSKKLYVIFSGSRNSGEKLPIFRRWSYYKFIPGNVLCIADPMLRKFNELNLGWYYGVKDVSWIHTSVDIIKSVLKKNNLAERDLCCLGSSGGGYASIQVASHFDGASALCINPQIMISKYPSAKEFQKIVNIDLDEDDPYQRNKTMERMISNRKSKYFIVQNLTDFHHCENHLFPILERYAIQPRLGLSTKSNLLVCLYSCSGGHNAQENKVLFSHFLYTLNKFQEGDDFCISEYDDFLYSTLLCLWRQLKWLESIPKDKSLQKNKIKA